ncbi:MAG: tRNA (adenosine(37)-N6)-dimethylallyltransferase MiaA [Thermodesulfovibrionales bacterium]|nr:tRNA (adenosine(37)-N6)-dimethylallyltransferase MiaA [Thermodesulfovibrionales bacterium]
MSKEVIILLGPTSVGKTEVSVILAERLNTEIISADSMQVYRGMDIGTAKPSLALRSKIKHHMIDICEPSEEFSTGRYIEEVKKIIDRLHDVGKIPIVVGGTGLYIRAMTRGLFSGVSADWGLREELNRMEDEQPGYLYEYLRNLDPEAASRIMASDRRRLIRAIEVCLLMKGKISEFQREHTKPLPYNFIKIGLMRDRKELYRLIEERIDRMIEAGLVGEVKWLLEQTPSRTTLQAIGYKELIGYLKGEISLQEAIRLIKKRTKLYAKRQFTWFKKEPDITWIDVTGIREPEEILARILPYIALKISTSDPGHQDL